MATVTFVDETTSGLRRDAWRLWLPVDEERLTLRELIVRHPAGSPEPR
ncbi:hypothetical protein ACGF12_37000 [Kitasatospora sp. NPDC048296]